MAVPSKVSREVLSEGDGGGFGSWLDQQLEALGVDQASCLRGLHPWCPTGRRGQESGQGILSTFLEEDSLLDICKEIVKR